MSLSPTPVPIMPPNILECSHRDFLFVSQKQLSHFCLRAFALVLPLAWTCKFHKIGNIVYLVHQCTLSALASAWQVVSFC